VPVSVAGAAGVALTLAGAHRWFGAAFTRRAFLLSPLGRLQVVVPALLAASTLAAALASSTPHSTWRALALAHAAWLLLTWTAALTTTRRARAL
jgi:hypothetical protein